MAKIPVEVIFKEDALDAQGPGARFGRGSDEYELIEEIGSGAAARVYSCRRVLTGEFFAVKVINLQRLQLMSDYDSHLVKLSREVQILRELHHPRIVNLVAVHQTKNWCFLVMELVRGGELFEHIVKKRSLSEVEARYIFVQLLDGIGYMHSKHVIHRDLKPENILISSSRPMDPSSDVLRDVKIADFGLSKIVSENASFAKTFVGTPQYWAPEVLNVQRDGGSYTKAADYWSLGAVLFVMLCGRYPFDGKKMPLEAQIQTAAFNMTAKAWETISEEAKDVVRGLLRVSVTERWGLEECLKHPWVVGRDVAPALPSMHFAGTMPAASGPIASFAPPSGPSGIVAPDNETVGPRTSSGGSGEKIVRKSESQSGSDVSNVVTSPPRVQSVQSFEERVSSHGNGGYPEVKTRQHQVHTIELGSSAHGPCAGVAAHPVQHSDQDTIFCLNELLKLQVSIASSLEVACLAFRHHDLELSEAIQKAFRQARDLCNSAAQIVIQYAHVAQQVSQMVLPDLKLAIEEKEPALARDLLKMVREWVTAMKRDGEGIQQRYNCLQDFVRDLISRAQCLKVDADHRLAEEGVGRVSPAVAPLPWTAPGCGEDVRGPSGSLVGQRMSETLPVPSVIPMSYSPSKVDSTTENRLSLPCSMNQWTQRLFDRLSVLERNSDRKDACEGSTVALSNTFESGPSEEDWTRDVLDLLFMAPGVSRQNLPRDEQHATQLPRVTSVVTSCSPESRSLPPSSCVEDADDIAEVIDRPPSLPAEVNQHASHAMVLRSAVRPKEFDAARNSVPLLRALRELKRVDEILLGCSAFWANMDGTVQKLMQMKEHTECLVEFACKSAALRQRFDQRLGEYTCFWSSLEGLCRQYCSDHQAASKSMYDMIRRVDAAADVLETANSARLGDARTG